MTHHPRESWHEAIFPGVFALVVAWLLACWAHGGVIPAGPMNQAQVDAAGSTVYLAPGDHPVSATIILKPGTTLTGSPDAVVVSRNVYAIQPSDNVTITGITFDGNGIGWSDGPKTGLVIKGNKFRGRAWTAGQPAITAGGSACIAWTQKPVNSQIVNNLFDPIECWTAIYGYGWDDLIITGNVFKNRQNPANKPEQGRCIKLHGAGANANTFPEGANNQSLRGVCQKLYIGKNYFGGVRGMGIEYQDGSIDDVVEDNFFEDPIFTSNDWHQNADVWGFSIVAARSVNLICRRNTLISTQRPDGFGLRTAIELGGYNVTCEDNLVVGPMNAGIAFNGSNGTGVIRNNKLLPDVTTQYGGQDGKTPIITANGAHPTITNNGKDVMLSWDVNRPKPVIGGVIVTPPTPVAGFALTLGIVDVNTVRLNWIDAPSDAAYAIVRVISTSGRETGDHVGPKAKRIDDLTRPATISGLHQGWTLDFNVELYNAANQLIATAPKLTQQMPGDPTVTGVAATQPVVPPATQPVVTPPDPIVRVDVVHQSGKVETSKP
jgi:hypothetical protein